MTPRDHLDGHMTITIVGLGLMGGSLALALRRHSEVPRLIGVVRSQERVAEAWACNVVDDVTTDLESAVRAADMVILATPVRTLIRQIRRIGPYLKPDAVVLDLGSTKAAICQALATLPAHVQPVGGHPMCGKEVTGLAHAEASLYEGATFILCPLPRTAPWALALCHDLIARLGARPLILDPERHDELVAVISHLPYLLAVALMATAHRVGEKDPRVWQVAASGFRDTSRLASSDVKMMMDILLTNREAVLSMVDAYLAELQVIRELLEQEGEGPLYLHLTSMKTLRDAHFSRGEVSVHE